MIDKTWLQARVDQAAAGLRGESWTAEEVATLAVATGLQYGAHFLRESLSLDAAQREAGAAALDKLADDLIGDR